VTKTVIHDNQRGILIQKGNYQKMLSAGKYLFFGDSLVEIFTVGDELVPSYCTLDTLLADSEAASDIAVVTVSVGHLALHYVNGVFAGLVSDGRHAWLSGSSKHEFHDIDTANPEFNAEATAVLSKLPCDSYTCIHVAPYEKARLYFNQRYVRLLSAGRYLFWNGQTEVSAETVDTRFTQLLVNGQELLTADKVTIRITYVCNCRVTDCEKIGDIENYQEKLYMVAQLALRDYVGSCTLDELLTEREKLSSAVNDALTKKAPSLFVEIADGGIRDIILPGEIRDIMNTVLIAEKKAQANVITRREEVASTRSLLNTAKLMDENKTLYRLKELEYVTKVCEQVGSISLGSGDILTQLSDLLLNGKTT